MTKFSWSFRPRESRFHFFIACLACLAIFISCVNGAATFVCNRQVRIAQRWLRDAGLADIRIRSVFFSVSRGLALKGIECVGGGHIFFAAKELGISFDPALLWRRELRIKNMRLRGGRFYTQRISFIASLMQQIAQRLGRGDLKFAPTVYFSGHDLWFDDAALADVQGYASSIPGDLLISRGELRLRGLKSPAFAETDFLRGSHFYKSFDFVFEAEKQGKDIALSRVELSNAHLQFTGAGRIRDVAGPAPEAVFVMNFMNVVLDDMPAFNNNNLKARGIVDAALEVKGPVADLSALLHVKLANVDCHFLGALSLSKINGSAVIVKDRLLSRGLSLEFNGEKLLADVTVERSAYPHVEARLSAPAPKEPGPAPFTLDLTADWAHDEIVGDAAARFAFSSPDTVNILNVRLSEFHLALGEELLLTADGLSVGFSIEAKNASPPRTFFNRELILSHFFGVLRRKGGDFALEDLKAICYGGVLEGGLDFVVSEERQGFKGEAHLREVDLNEFFGKTQDVPLGRLDGDLRFDTRSVDMLKGQLFVTKGIVDQNPLFNAVADFLGVASLKRVAYDELAVFFAGGRGDYTSQVKLESPKVRTQLDTKITSYDKMDGYLAVVLATELLKESKQFRKILAYLRHDEPSVVFPFKISSYINSPRVLWLKNEFKEKLQGLLPERNKRFLQRQVNDMVEKINEE